MLACRRGSPFEKRKRRTCRAERLRAMNCDMVQGYLLSRPMGVIETEAWMRGSIWTKAPGEMTALRRVV